jgi:hypothetical protein
MSNRVSTDTIIADEIDRLIARTKRHMHALAVTRDDAMVVERLVKDIDALIDMLSELQKEDDDV